MQMLYFTSEALASPETMIKYMNHILHSYGACDLARTAFQRFGCLCQQYSGRLTTCVNIFLLSPFASMCDWAIHIAIVNTSMYVLV